MMMSKKKSKAQLIKDQGRPVLPTKAQFKDPTKQGTNRARAISSIDARYAKIKSKITKEIGDFLSNVPKTFKQSNILQKLFGNKRVYDYNVDTSQIGSMSLLLQQILEEFIDVSPDMVEDPGYWLSGFVENAYNKGSIDTLQSAKNISTSSNVGAEASVAIRTIPIESLINDPQYRRRVGLVAGRTFNKMRGLSETTRADLADTLARGMANGQGIAEITDRVRARIDVSRSNARRIARTEINNAYRTATRQEMTEINNRLFADQDFKMALLWFSALSATTRENHASRHGRTYSAEDVAIFYSEAANAINCLCSQTQVLIDADGNVVQEAVAGEMSKQRKEWEKVEKEGLNNNSSCGCGH